MNGVRRAVVVAAISAVCLGACGDDAAPVDAGNSGTTEVMTDSTGAMTDKSEVMTDSTDAMTDKSEVMTDKTDVMTDKSTSTTAG